MPVDAGEGVNWITDNEYVVGVVSVTSYTDARGLSWKNEAQVEPGNSPGLEIREPRVYQRPGSVADNLRDYYSECYPPMSRLILALLGPVVWLCDRFTLFVLYTFFCCWCFMDD